MKFLDLGATYYELKSEIDQSVMEVMSSGSYILGSVVESFEFNYANYVGAKYCIGVHSGLSALSLALTHAGSSQ